MSLLRTLAYVATGRQHRAFVRDCRAPEEAYRRLWEREIEPLLRPAPFWAQRGLPVRLADCPLTDHGTYADAIDRSIQTGLSELSGEPVRYWAQSGGTSGQAKLFPLTARFRTQFQRTTGPFVHNLLRNFDGMLRNPVHYFAATAPWTSSPSGVPIGFISHFNYVTVPRVLQAQYAVPRAALRDDATARHGGPLYALATELSAMLAVTPQSLSGMLDALTQHWEEYLDVLAGRRPMPVDLPRPTIAPARLAMLRGLDPASFTFKQVWPGLACVVTWTSSVCQAQLRPLQPRLGVPACDATYSATEGWMNVPFGDGVREGGPLHPGAHIVEFLPEGAAAEVRNLVPPWELEPGRNYEVFLTTAQGMVRYRLYDVVECTGRFERSPVISFRYKSGRNLSLGLATVSETELVQASLAAGLELQSHWRFGPTAGGDGLALFVPSGVTISAEALARVDAEMRRVNATYALERTSGPMPMLAVEHVPPEHRFWQRAAQHAQTKPQYLIPHRPEG